MIKATPEQIKDAAQRAYIYWLEHQHLPMVSVHFQSARFDIFNSPPPDSPVVYANSVEILTFQIRKVKHEATDVTVLGVFLQGVDQPIIVIM